MTNGKILETRRHDKVIMRDGLWRWADATGEEHGTYLRHIETGERFERMGTGIAMPTELMTGGMPVWDKENRIRYIPSMFLVRDDFRLPVPGDRTAIRSLLVLAAAIFAFLWGVIEMVNGIQP